MNKELRNIDEAIKNILKKTEDDEILSNLAQISKSIRIVKENWFDISALIESNRKLVDDKKFVVADIVLLVKYIQGDKTLEYQAKNIINNYNNKRVVNR